MHGMIPLLFSCWADPVAHLLLLKSSMLFYFVLILPCRWQDGGECLGMETTSYQWSCPLHTASTIYKKEYINLPNLHLPVQGDNLISTVPLQPIYMKIKS